LKNEIKIGHLNCHGLLVPWWLSELPTLLKPEHIDVGKSSLMYYISWDFLTAVRV